MVSLKFLVVLALIAAVLKTTDATSIRLKKANSGIGKAGFVKGLGSVFNGLGGSLKIGGGLLGNLLQPSKPSGFSSSIDLTVDLSLGCGEVLDKTLIGGLGKLLAKIYIAISKITVCILGPANCKVCQGTYYGIGPVKAKADISVFLKKYGLLDCKAKLQALIEKRSKRKGITFFSPSQQVVLNAGLKLADILSVNIGKQDLTKGLVQLSIVAGAIGTTRSKKDGTNISGGLVDTLNAHLDEQDYTVITPVNYETITSTIAKCNNDKGAFDKVTETESGDDDNTDQDNNDQANKDNKADKEKEDKESEDKDKAAKDKAAKDKDAKNKATKDKADKDKAAKDKADKDKAAKDKADKDKAAKDKADKEKEDKEREDKDKAAKDKAAKDKEAKNKATKDKADKDKAAKDKADKEKAEKDKAAKDKAAKDKADKEKKDKEREDKEKAEKDKAAKDKAAKDKDAKDKAIKDKAAKDAADKEKEDKERKDKKSDNGDDDQGNNDEDNDNKGDDYEDDDYEGSDDQSGDDQSGDDEGGDDQGGNGQVEGGKTISISVGSGIGGLGNAVQNLFGVLKGTTKIVGSAIESLLNFKNPRNFDDSVTVSVQLFQGFGSLLDVSFIKGLGSLVVKIFVLISKITICVLGKVDCSLCNANYAGIGKISGDITTIIKNAGLSNCNQDIKLLISKKSNGKGITSFTAAEQIVLNNILDLSLLLNAKISKQTLTSALKIGITIFGSIGNSYSVQDRKTGDNIISGLVDVCGRYLKKQGFTPISQTDVDGIVFTAGKAKKDTKAAWCVKK